MWRSRSAAHDGHGDSTQRHRDRARFGSIDAAAILSGTPATTMDDEHHRFIDGLHQLMDTVGDVAGGVVADVVSDALASFFNLLHRLCDLILRRQRVGTRSLVVRPAPSRACRRGSRRGIGQCTHLDAGDILSSAPDAPPSPRVDDDTEFGRMLEAAFGKSAWTGMLIRDRRFGTSPPSTCVLCALIALVMSDRVTPNDDARSGSSWQTRIEYSRTPNS